MASLPDNHRFCVTPGKWSFFGHPHKMVTTEYWDKTNNRWVVIEKCSRCNYEVNVTEMRTGCPASKDWKHHSETRTFIQPDGKFAGQLMIEKRCTKCDIKFQTLFERAMNLTTINLD